MDLRVLITVVLQICFVVAFFALALTAYAYIVNPDHFALLYLFLHIKSDIRAALIVFTFLLLYVYILAPRYWKFITCSTLWLCTANLHLLGSVDTVRLC